MGEATTAAFDELWRLATKADKSFNGLCYHQCCDTWTTRGAEAKRATHKEKIKWRKLMSTLDKSCEDKKQALRAKMAEERWKLPVVFNEACKVRPNPSQQQQLAFRLYQPQDLQTPPLLHNRQTFPWQGAPEEATPSSQIILTQT